MTAIKTRIVIADVNIPEKPFYYTSDHRELYRLGVKIEKGPFNPSYISIDDILHTPSGKYKVVSIETKFQDEWANTGEYGINVHGHGDFFPYNFEITYLVEEA